MIRHLISDRSAYARRVAHALAVGLIAAGLAACAGSAPHDESAAPAVAIAGAPLTRANTWWLERVDFGLDSETLAAYRQLGREGFLEQQLSARNDSLPPAIAAQIAALDVSHLSVTETLAAVRRQRRAINAIPDPAQKQQARQGLNQQGAKLAAEASRRELLRAVYSSGQLREQMVWFWLNHFSVDQNKADLRWLIGDYEEQAIRPHALGHFRDLVLATLEHPAMLEYLDNFQNVAGRMNENYAREFMELHTLGVGAGYSQQDVQQLARVFTGVGVNPGPAPRLPRELQGLYARRGAFEFNPARHDFGPKVLFGQRLHGRGFAEVENAVTLIVHQRACAQFISHQLATYFVADDPPAPLVDAMAQTFERTDGDIAAVLRTMFTAPQFNAALGGKFKDPMRYVVSAVRLAYDGRTVRNPQPLLNWLNALGEAPYARQTPDGYPLTQADWSSPGQVSRRFEIARVIGSGNPRLFDATDGGADAPNAADGVLAGATAVNPRPQLPSPLYFETIAPFLADQTRAALVRANSPQEWNAFLLSSPEFNYE